MSKFESDHPVDPLCEKLARLDDRLAEHPDSSVDDDADLRRLKETLDEIERSLDTAFANDLYSQLARESEFQASLDKAKDVARLAADGLLANERSSRKHDSPLTGTILGSYEIYEPLAHGGMGAVYHGLQIGLGRDVALKTLPAFRMNNPRAVTRFQREMKAIGKLDHPHIVKAIDAGEVNGIHYLAMELVDGIDLSALSNLSGTLAVSDACEMVRQAALGLQYIHSQGLIHRDIKPSNLMLTRTGQVKILDLGLAQLIGDSEEELTRTGQVMGTFEYMAPEQSLDAHRVDIRADIYSLGATLYKLLAGVSPFGDDKYSHPMKKMRAILDEPIPGIETYRSSLPKKLVAVLERSLQKQPANRFAEPHEFASALEPFCKGCELPRLAKQALGGSAGDVQPFPTAEMPAKTKSIFTRTVVIGLTGIAIAVSLIFALRDTKNEKNAPSRNSAPPAKRSVPVPLTSLELHSGFFLLQAPPGQSVLPIGVASDAAGGSPRVLGHLLQSTGEWGSNFEWTTGGFAELKPDGDPAARLLDCSADGKHLLVRTPSEYWVVRPDGIDVVPKHGYMPEKISADGKHLIETHRSPASVQRVSLATFDLTAQRENEVAYLEPVSNPRILCATSDLSWIVGTCNEMTTASEPQRIAWEWSVSTGMRKLQFPGVDDSHLILPRGITADDRYVFGSHHKEQPFVWNRVAGEVWSETKQLPDGVVTGMTRDAALVVGFHPGHESWVWSAANGTKTFSEWLGANGLSSDSLKNTRIVGISHDDRYLYGTTHRGSAQGTDVWLLDLESFSERQERSAETSLREDTNHDQPPLKSP